MREQTGSASRGEERKPLYGLSEMGETLLYLFPVESVAAEVSEEKSSDLLNALKRPMCLVK